MGAFRIPGWDDGWCTSEALADTPYAAASSYNVRHAWPCKAQKKPSHTTVRVLRRSLGGQLSLDTCCDAGRAVLVYAYNK